MASSLNNEAAKQPDDGGLNKQQQVNEEAKNMALLFFMDHLMAKNGRRTIHDLSCQFGARGFSQEMREAVGSTQEGLTEFLGQFPSLFFLEGDNVTLTGYGDLASGGSKASPLLQSVTSSRDRNYELEAVHFFEEKLKRFGPELQIKSLLGHRSQSAPEIRLVSGRHVKDFTSFLIAHPDHFVVENDRVRLRHMPEPVDRCSSTEPEEVNQDTTFDEFGQPLSPLAISKRKALNFLKIVVESGGAATNSPGLNSSLKPEQQSALLVPPVPIDALYKKFCDRFAHSFRQQVATNPKELLQFLKLNRHIFFIRSNKVSIVRNKIFNSAAGSGTTANGSGGSSSTDSPSSENGDDDSGAKLNAADNTSDDAAGGSPPGFGQSFCRPIVVKSLLSAQNALIDLAKYCLHVTAAQNNNNNNNFAFNHQQSNNNNMFNNNLCLNGKPAVGLDFKCVHLGDRQFFSLIIMALGDGSKIYIFDVAHSSSLLMESGLKELLEDDEVVKVIHDCSRIGKLLYEQYKICFRNVFDTQIANTVLQHQRTERPLHDIKPISFSILQRLYYPQSLMFGGNRDAFQPNEESNWSKRPLSDDLIDSCVEQVRLLMPFIYRTMAHSLKPEMKGLFDRLCREAVSNSWSNLETFSAKNGLLNSDDQNINRSFTNNCNSKFGDNRFSSSQRNGKYSNNNNYMYADQGPPCCSCSCHHHSSLSAKSSGSGAKVKRREIACQTVASGDDCVIYRVIS